MILSIIVIIIIVGICVSIFSPKSGGIKCDHCGYKFTIPTSRYNQWASIGKKCPKCGKCVNKE